MQNRWIILLFVIIVCSGCKSVESPFGKANIEIARPNPVKQGNSLEELFRFHYSGAYQIVDVDRFYDSLAMAKRQAPKGWEYTDGAITLTIRPTPYGLRLFLFNHLSMPLSVAAKDIYLLDETKDSHPVEIRHSSALYLMDPPSSQELWIPPRSSMKFDVDAIAPLHRQKIVSQAKDDEERGAFVVTGSPLPIFCSGYFLYRSRLPEFDVMRRWAMGRRFGLYIVLGSNSRQFGYVFTITPARFTLGPDADEEESISTSNPTPPAGYEDRFRR